jgi:tRNA/rRNA methyltransferase
MSAFLSQVRIVLVEPAGARNLGSIARVMKNMGLSRLVLVSPECDHLCEEAMHMAVHAGDLLAAAEVVPTLLEALTGCERVVATLGRQSDRPLESPRQLLPWATERIRGEGGADCAIVFGREDHGLNNRQLDYAQRYLCIPTGADYPSLNLAQAVGICCYELQGLVDDLPEVRQAIYDAPRVEQVEGYLEDLAQLLLEVGFLYPHTQEARVAKLRSLLKRAHPEVGDLAMLRGMVRQVRWAIGRDG